MYMYLHNALLLAVFCAILWLIFNNENSLHKYKRVQKNISLAKRKVDLHAHVPGLASAC